MDEKTVKWETLVDSIADRLAAIAIEVDEMIDGFSDGMVFGTVPPLDAEHEIVTAQAMLSHAIDHFAESVNYGERPNE